MKILFLDIDGVVNCQDTFTKRPYEPFPLDAYMAFLVGKIVMDTRAAIVLSSSWRGHHDGEEQIRTRIYDFIDRTPRLDSGFRGDEIREWLLRHPEVSNYAILDDDSDFYPHQYLFKTDWKTGLTESIARDVIVHLNKP